MSEMMKPFGYVSDDKSGGYMRFQHEPFDQMHLLVHSTAPVYTAAQLQEAARQAMEGHEKMRGGKPVAFWRDDALEAAAGIAEAYQANPQIAIDIRAMKSRLKEWWRGPSPATGSES